MRRPWNPQILGYWNMGKRRILMGTEVYNADNLAPGVNVYVHNIKGGSEGHTALIINVKKSDYSFEILNNAE